MPINLVLHLSCHGKTTTIHGKSTKMSKDEPIVNLTIEDKMASKLPPSLHLLPFLTKLPRARANNPSFKPNFKASPRLSNTTTLTMRNPFFLLYLTLPLPLQAQHLISLALGAPSSPLLIEEEPLPLISGRSAILSLRADAPPTCSPGESVCDTGCIPRGANCCRFGNNAYCDEGEYCSSDNICCPLGKACPGPGACKEGFVRCGEGCIPVGFVCCTSWYCKLMFLFSLTKWKQERKKERKKKKGKKIKLFC